MSINVQNGTHDHDQWDLFGLDALLDSAEMDFRNERESGYGDDEGEWFATPDDTTTGPDGTFYRVIFTGTHGNDHSPGTSGNTSADLYDVADPDDMAEYARDVARWEALPERIDDDSDDASWGTIDTSTD